MFGVGTHSQELVRDYGVGGGGQRSTLWGVRREVFVSILGELF